ncbi:DUF6907 domain-containing protein [Streptomyces sp. NPDC058284]|uniref:DUF6907 domain-containing protein n=1 Tax=unclassified Streptomyces TaxID=2593676 RepID=UPI00364B61E4
MSVAIPTTPNSVETKDLAAVAFQLAKSSPLPANADHDHSNQQLCTVHPDWCIETGVHDAHLGACHVVIGNDGRELLDARLLDFHGSETVICLGETDTDAVEARLKATELRRFADKLEFLADKVNVSNDHEQPRSTEMTACPNGVSFCDGNPRDHKDPHERFHHGPLISMGAHRPYSSRHGEGIMAFHPSQINDETPRLVFVADGDWPTLSLGEIDELISDMSRHLAKLRAAGAQIAVLMSEHCGATTSAPDHTWT